MDLDGASHHALEDLCLTRVWPVNVLTPADAEEIADALSRRQNKGPFISAWPANRCRCAIRA